VNADDVLIPQREPGVTVSDTILQNEHLALRVHADRLDLVDKATGRVFHDVQAFLDEADAGDEYNFSPLDGDLPRRASLVSATVAEASPHRGVLEVRWSLLVPTGLAPDRAGRMVTDVELGPVTRFTLEAGAKLIQARTTIENRANDHRLRLVVGGARASAEAWAEGTFGVFHRELAPPPVLPVEKRSEAVMPEFPQGRFTALVDGEGGLATAGIGLHEAGVVETADGGKALALTLIRSVGWLSRDDLRTRGGGAGPRFPTPEAQCLGTHLFEHALVPLATGWQDALAPIEGWFAPPAAWAGGGPAAGAALVAWDGVGLQLSALKRSVDGEALVVRLFNPGPQPVAGRLRVLTRHGGVATADLAEEAIVPLGEGDSFDAPFRPYEIRTWRITKP
jgi:alpha-mannosidase